MKINTETQITPEMIALTKFLECDSDDLSISKHTHYGLPVFELGSREFAVGNDIDAQIAAERYIKDSIWAFNASFILSYCGLPMELEEVIQDFQGKKCESANDALFALVEKTGLEGFVEQAISADGRGHFLSPYDGEENEQDDYYIYRVN